MIIQHWQGYVTEVTAVTFWARLKTIVGEGSESEAEIYIEKVSADDRSLIVPGAVFDWTIDDSGESSIEFVRGKPWTAEDFENAAAVGRELMRVFE